MQKTKLKSSRAVFAALASLASLTVAGATLTSCSPGFNGSNPVVDRIDNSLGCKNFEDELWSSFAASVESYGRPPTADEVEQAMKTRLGSSSHLSKISTNAKVQLTDLSADLAKTIALRTDHGVSAQNLLDTDDDARRGAWLERIAQLEIGDRTTEAKSKDVDVVREKIAKMKALAESEGIVGTACLAEPTPDASPAPGSGSTPGQTATPAPTPSSLFDAWKATQPPAVYGGMKSVATIYQSCEAATRAPLGNDVGNVQGISTTGRHPSGTGYVRVVSDKTAFLKSQPYIGTIAYHRPLPSCHDVQAVPSIYDYGGKPYTSTANEKEMNFFKNAGTGSKELGIDCSGLVYSAYVTSGLKFKRESAMKASLVNGVSSTMMKDPQKNGLTCLDYASFTSKKNLVAGDIIAIAGHVVMVASVGADPFGIAALNSASQCTLSNMSISRFNFTIYQSSPSKNGIGVNRMRAKDYLSSGSTMGRGMLDHAVNACKAKFQTASLVSKSSSASVIRHLGTSACIDPVPVHLTKEECMSSCSVQNLDSI